MVGAAFGPIADTSEHVQNGVAMRKAAIILLVLFTLAFDLCVLWMLWFSLSWGMRLPHGNEWIGFSAIVLAPLLVTAYCMAKLRAFRNGGFPRI